MGIDASTRYRWYGHSCWEIVSPGGVHILLDPWFSNPKSPTRPEQVTACDLLLLSHGHFDHADDAIPLASRLRPDWPCIHELSLWLGRHLPGGSQSVVAMNKGGMVEMKGIKVTMVSADHSAGDWSTGIQAFENPAPVYLGEPVGFVIEMENGHRVYFAGDTQVFGDMRLIAELYRPDVAILPIGGHFTMGPREAALAVELLGVDTVVPTHFGTFPILAGTPEALREELSKRGVRADVVATEPGGQLG
ncbi:MAG TPA: metal-dependent hydrolase [Candidatus Limnocylindrales bacterium]|nr:metal-dependent hydrolase [Candidatus Limnocylindrales bacterium]